MTIQLVNKEWLRDRSTRWVRFCNEIAVKGGTMLVDIHPPTWLVPAVLGRGTWPGIRVLRGISTAPILRPDGSIFQTPGYDSVTGVVCSPTYQTPIMVPDQPTAEQVRQACDLLLEVVVDFPFFSPAHRAAWLAALLTVIARWVFEGKAPLFLFDSNIRGSGKTLQIQTIAMIAFGRDAAMSGYSNDDDEMRKRITSIALAADPLVVLDNLGGVFGGPALDRALTATRWKDRILCTNVEVDLPLDVVWAATGNNIALAADTVRRTVHIRLDCQDESPEKRSGFRHPKLVEWVKDNRERLLAAALTVLSAFLRTKPRPGADLPPFGGFEGWSDVIRGCVVWLGLPDPCSTRAELEATSDTTTGPLAALMDAWEKFVKPGQPIVLSTLLGQLYATREAGRYALTTPEALALRAALEAITRVPAGRPPSAGQVAAKLQTFRRRVIDGCSFEVDAEAGRRGGRAWRLISPAAPLGAPLAPQTGDGRDTGDGLGNAA